MNAVPFYCGRIVVPAAMMGVAVTYTIATVTAALVLMQVGRWINGVAQE